MKKLRAKKRQDSGRKLRASEVTLGKLGVALTLLIAALPLAGREKEAVQYGVGLTMSVPFAETEVEKVVQDVAQNGIIRGTREYNKEEYISGAVAASTTRVFPEWEEGGKIFYKVRLKALVPRNFKDSSDVGTLAVRYVVQGQGDRKAIVRIDAVFVEDFRHVSHASDGSVEGAEYKDIHDRLDALDLMKAQTVEAQKERQSAKDQRPTTSSEAATPQPVTAVASPSDLVTSGNTQPPQTLQERVQDLRRQVERRVKAPGAPLKSAPFHSASTLEALPADTEVLIVVSTPYWLGVETRAGQHGWILRDDLELLP